MGYLRSVLKTKNKTNKQTEKPQSYSQELLHNKLYVKVMLVVQLAFPAFTEEPENAACSRPLLQLYLAVGYSGRILGMNLLLFLP